MKKTLIAAAALALISVGGNSFAADLIDAERFVNSMQDSYNGYTYKNITNYDKFVAALEDNYNGYTYKNIYNLDSFVAQLGDNYDGRAYRNTMDIERFIAELEDDYTAERYQDIMGRTRFAVLAKAEGVQAEAGAYINGSADGFDYLQVVLAK